jgi:hypothetical protein
MTKDTFHKTNGITKYDYQIIRNTKGSYLVIYKGYYLTLYKMSTYWDVSVDTVPYQTDIWTIAGQVVDNLCIEYCQTIYDTLSYVFSNIDNIKEE